MHDAAVVARSSGATAPLLTVALPAGIDARHAAGRFFLARCAPGDAATRPWDPFLRQPLFPAAIQPQGEQIHWTLLLPPLSAADAPALPYPLRAEAGAAEFLHALRPGDTLNLLGPYGSGFRAEARTRALLLVTDAPHAPLLLPLIEESLNHGARVTLLLAAGAPDPSGAPDSSGAQAPSGAAGSAAARAQAADALAPLLPLAVELRAEAHAALAETVAGLATWADQICLALPSRHYAQIGAQLRRARLRIAPGELQALAEAPLPCGVGACLACTVDLAGGGHTRACIHGPVMDLLRLA